MLCDSIYIKHLEQANPETEGKLRAYLSLPRYCVCVCGSGGLLLNRYSLFGMMKNFGK
jgi:hypothetical protein